MPDVKQIVINGMKTVLDAHATLVALTGRPNGNVVPWEDIASTALPAIAVSVEEVREIGGARDNRHLDILAAAFGYDLEKVNAMAEFLEDNLTQPQLEAAGLDAIILRRTRRAGPTEKVKDRRVRREDMTLLMWITV